MQILKFLLLPIFLISSFSAQAEEVVSVYARSCIQGIHKQPKGIFALHVFCDDALGTNVAVFFDDLGAPFSGKYNLGNRFWQGEEWNYDVTSFSWLKENRLLLATSNIYGSGDVFMLNLEEQTYKVIFPSEPSIFVTQLKSIRNKRVELITTECQNLKEGVVEIAL